MFIYFVWLVRMFESGVKEVWQHCLMIYLEKKSFQKIERTRPGASSLSLLWVGGWCRGASGKLFQSKLFHGAVKLLHSSNWMSRNYLLLLKIFLSNSGLLFGLYSLSWSSQKWVLNKGKIYSLIKQGSSVKYIESSMWRLTVLISAIYTTLYNNIEDRKIVVVITGD